VGYSNTTYGWGGGGDEREVRRIHVRRAPDGVECYYHSRFRVGICLTIRKKCSIMQCFGIYPLKSLGVRKMAKTVSYIVTLHDGADRVDEVSLKVPARVPPRLLPLRVGVFGEERGGGGRARAVLRHEQPARARPRQERGGVVLL
jgi:hypothetical protein